jgi:hypothetical protein
MAETKNKAKAKKPKVKAQGKAKAKGKAKTKKASSPASRAKSTGSKAAKSGSDTATEASSNGHAPGAKKVVLPLLAAGAAVAGAGATAVIAGKRGQKHKVLGVSVPKPKVGLPRIGVPKPKVGKPSAKGLKKDVRKAAGAVADVAKQADQIGKGISRVASSVQTVGETTQDAAKKA